MNIIVFLSLIFFLNIGFSQETIQNSNIKTFVECGRKSKVLNLEESINSFDLQHIESMISSYKIKLAIVDTNIKENKSWKSRIKFELILLESRKRELLKK